MHRFTALTLVALALLLAMGLWFGVSAVAPQIAREWRLSCTTLCTLSRPCVRRRRSPTSHKVEIE